MNYETLFYKISCFLNRPPSYLCIVKAFGITLRACDLRYIPNIV